MRVGIVRFPGSNCDDDAMRAIAGVLGEEGAFVWHKDKALLAVDAVIGICNGFQILCEAGLLPGALARNASLHFECRDVFLRVEGKPMPFTSAILAGRVLRMPIAHGEGCYVFDDPAGLAARGQVIFR